MATDLADMPADLLERAASQWAVKSPYMPKASDLVALAKAMLPAPTPTHLTGVNTADQYNRRLESSGRSDLRWVGSGADLRLQWA